MDALALWQYLGLAVVGLLAGAVNAVAGGGSMLSFPALVVMGVPPVTANVTNSVAALPGYLGGSVGYRAELTGQGRRIGRLAPVSLLGATGGALALLAVSAEVFRAVVPWLVLVSAVLLAAQPRIASWAARHGARSSRRGLLLSQFLVAFYGGFFVAGLGIVMLAALGVFLADTTHRLNALKGVLSLLVGSVSALVFVLFTSVAWGPAIVLAATGLLGGRLGVMAARRISPSALRGAVAAWGLGIAIALEVSRHVS
ncbi:sulfite exporter TauE/SafE family protein (plasmid) [Streptomyces sp. NBC_01795]|uniref:sulfite exporter TauE/SafE family protein n=1 Tax=unclassified Streptomyces TaxID=2593676 RepID=UPI002DDAAE17|nr:MULTISPECIES: sulfite exporter TauE/SafE family protein [unclassified Streptomyces]WSA97638.1 sulfite exporter TauE/SafE family protein [Streptomyces sp. NBC_01795]WSB82112.1 sulfite exporter TauE/SafE family protein [Streptomyces sp. NBC_01775]WSS18083.1 sulfite exporter TauE/SafE family protein [Streptomyces sp. NBC_01186]